MTNRREHLLAVTKADMDIETFRSGGPGGQYQNKRDSGVRIRHPPSGAIGEARDRRSQHQNRRAAFERMVATPEFQAWLKEESAKALMTIEDKRRLEADIKRTVDRQMLSKNLRVECLIDGDWVAEPA